MLTKNYFEKDNVYYFIYDKYGFKKQLEAISSKDLLKYSKNIMDDIKKTDASFVFIDCSELKYLAKKKAIKTFFDSKNELPKDKKAILYEISDKYKKAVLDCTSLWLKEMN